MATGSRSMAMARRTCSRSSEEGDRCQQDLSASNASGSREFPRAMAAASP